ncbi:MAG TPA: MBOAT family O-acyltransferase [Burkholderiaceae bacterium]|jgi:alginate O-acetyltransferase complex protein AlgI
MLFVELRFFVFFALLLTAYWRIRSNENRKWLLLAASYFFYGSWDWRFALMLAALSCADFCFALQIDGSTDPLKRRRFVIASIAMNLTVLGVFKYFNFFIDNFVALAAQLNLSIGRPALRIALPVGVSFFTFQSLSYTIDVYRQEIPAARRLKDYLLFAAFFPQLVAGPIVRPKYFLPQLVDARRIDAATVKAMLTMFLIGFIKKSGIADNISPYVDQVFAAPMQYSTAASITATWLYAVQIYCDFSGYTDMATAVAGLLGYRLAINFDAPYLATSIQDFWRRWHISLSTWIRDYIYLSLGGSRGEKRWLTHRNLLVTMLAGGLWHGAAWTFVAWGGLHGAALVVRREFVRRLPNAGASATRLRALLGWLLTINFVCIGWIVFRAADFGTAEVLIGQYTMLLPGGQAALPAWLTLLPPALLLVQFGCARFPIQAFIVGLKTSRLAFVLGAGCAVALAMLPLGDRPFIYFQF